LARRLAAETGVPEEKLLGNAKVIEGEVVQARRKVAQTAC
jgi:hypothetical protein